MLSKAKHPHLNRAARRHPKKHLAAIQQAMGTAKLAASALLHDLFVVNRIVGLDNITGGRDLTKAQQEEEAAFNEHMRGAVV